MSANLPIAETSRRPPRHARLKPLALRLWRAGVVLAILWLVRHEHAWLVAQRTPAVTLAEARRFFPATVSLSPRDPELGGHYARDAQGQPLGYLLTTLPETSNLIGYSGPTNVLIALDGEGAVLGAEILSSGDTEDHVELVQKDRDWLRAFQGWRPSEPLPRVAAVSGATLTSGAIAESIARRLSGRAPSLRFPEPITLGDVRELFPAAASFKPEESTGRLRVFSAEGALLGLVAHTSPWSDNVSGYRGPSESLVALGPDGAAVVGLRLRKSYDTPDYVTSVRDDDHWMRELFIGKSPEWLAKVDYERDGIEGVSGATETSWAMAEGMKRRFAALPAAAPEQWRIRLQDVLLALVVCGSLVMALSNLRGVRWARCAWQAILIGYVGLISGEMLSLELFAGWAEHGLAWRALPGLTLLLAAALIVPWATRRQLYCHQICPHGALQQWLGSWSRRQWRLPGALARWLSLAPQAILTFALVATLRGWRVDLAALEPFDAWSWRTAGWATIAIAVVGLALSLRIPQAYCRYGCPTGALLELVRSHGAADRFGRRDILALAMLLIGAIASPSWSANAASGEPAKPAPLARPTANQTTRGEPKNTRASRGASRAFRSRDIWPARVSRTSHGRQLERENRRTGARLAARRTGSLPRTGRKSGVELAAQFRCVAIQRPAVDRSGAGAARVGLDG